MDPSALIFVGLALAWAAYLIPKALEHHEAGARSRTVDRFSHTLRVLARREAVDRRQTRLVTNRKPSAAPAAEAPVPAPASVAEPEAAPDLEQTGFFATQTFVRRSAGSRAARKRRRVLGAILLVTALVGASGAGRVVSAWWIVAPLALLAGWLVACRMMVRGEQAVRRPAQRITDPAEPDPIGVEDAVRFDDTAEVPVVWDDAPTSSAQRVADAEPIASGDGWELVPVTLPTYVSKPAARRPVNAIDLDSTGVWTSGRTATDSALAQQADAVRAAGAVGAEAAGPQRRVSGA